MGYEEALVQIGSFGKWQKLVFTYASIVALGNALITFSQTSILFTPDLRCAVPGCDLEGQDWEYNSAFNEFAIPFWGQDEFDSSKDRERSQCEYYHRVLTGDVDTCSAFQFDNTSSSRRTLATFAHFWKKLEA